MENLETTMVVDFSKEKKGMNFTGEELCNLISSTTFQLIEHLQKDSRSESFNQRACRERVEKIVHNGKEDVGKFFERLHKGILITEDSNWIEIYTYIDLDINKISIKIRTDESKCPGAKGNKEKEGYQSLYMRKIFGYLSQKFNGCNGKIVKDSLKDFNGEICVSEVTGSYDFPPQEKKVIWGETKWEEIKEFANIDATSGGSCPMNF